MMSPDPLFHQKQCLLMALTEDRLEEAAVILHFHPKLLHRPLSDRDPLLVKMSALGRTERVEFLLNRGADVHVRSITGPNADKTALMVAAEKSLLGVAKLLMDWGAKDTDVTDAKVLPEVIPPRPPGPALHQATFWIWGIRYTLTYNWDENYVEPAKEITEGGWNSLMRAAYRNDAAMVAALLTRGGAAAALQRSSRGRSAWDVTPNHIVKSMLEFATDSAVGLPEGVATKLLLAHAPKERRRAALALLWAAKTLGADLDRAMKERLLACLVRDWMHSAVKAKQAAAGFGSTWESFLPHIKCFSSK